MLTNDDLILSDAELKLYNDWAKGIAKIMGKNDICDWEISMNYSFTILGTFIIATLSGSNEELIIRDPS